MPSKPCISCGSVLNLGLWESLNGFLAPCPACGRYHGRPWRPGPILFSSLFFSVLTFFFTLRPLAALGAAAAVVGLAAGLIAASESARSGLLELAGFLVLFFGPVLVNAAAFVRHQSRLGSPVEVVRPGVGGLR